MTDKKARDKYYDSIMTKVGKILPTTNFNFLFKTQQLKIRALSNDGQLIRDRFIHQNGYVAKGTILGYPCIVRISKQIAPNFTTFVGMGIRFWKDGEYSDFVIMNVLTRKNMKDFALPLSNDLTHSFDFERPLTIIVLFTVLLSFSLIGKKSWMNDLSLLEHGIQPYQTIKFISHTQKSMDEIVATGEKTVWDIVDQNGKSIGEMALMEFNPDPIFGYYLDFHHNLKNTV